MARDDDYDDTPAPVQENKKVVAGILGILLGGLGVHKFYLGYTKTGIIQLIVTFVTCGFGSIIGLIEGIIYLTKSDKEFYQTYQVGEKQWF
ncbi:TM2 domain-containing protein [Urbifossiella limnaea]|uniref:TM2 domain protein n=1 Tax=Urbifossiella limnaea TaxID=2528023 RepID=A0A517XMB7_9BACT|nr:TM2 domain-containing protein [Urbifossiella limnaea]QDU18653.1 TM2 domain protein [Urbifossiella limnaea]